MRIKRSISCFLTALIATGLLFTVGFTGTLLAGPTKWKCQAFYPIASPSWKGSVLKVVNQINTKLKGKFEIEVFPGGALVSAPEVINAVKRGMLPMGITAASYSLSHAPALGVAAGLPYAFPTASQAAYFYKLYGYEGLIQKVMKEKHGLLFFFDRVYPAELVTKKPIRSFDDFKGLIQKVMKEKHGLLFFFRPGIPGRTGHQEADPFF